MAGSVAIRIAYGYTVDDPNDNFIRSAEEFMTAIGEGKSTGLVAGSVADCMRAATIPGRWMVETMPFRK